MHISLLFFIWMFLPAVVYCNNTNCKVHAVHACTIAWEDLEVGFFRNYQSSTTYDGTFTRRDTLYSHENCRHFQTEIILFGDQHFLIRMKFGVCFRRTLLHLFQTHYCVPLEHTTAFNSIRNERSAFASKCRRTHQDVNTNTGFVLFERSCVFSFVFNCSNWNAFALCWQVFAWTVTYTGSGSI